MVTLAVTHELAVLILNALLQVTSHAIGHYVGASPTSPHKFHQMSTSEWKGPWRIKNWERLWRIRSVGPTHSRMQGLSDWQGL